MARYTDVRFFIRSDKSTRVRLPSRSEIESFMATCERLGNRVKIRYQDDYLTLTPDFSGTAMRYSWPKKRQGDTADDMHIEFSLPQALAKVFHGRFGIANGNEHLRCEYAVVDNVLVIDIEKPERGRLKKEPDPSQGTIQLECVEEAPEPKPKRSLPFVCPNPVERNIRHPGSSGKLDLKTPPVQIDMTVEDQTNRLKQLGYPDDLIQRICAKQLMDGLLR